MSTCFRLSHSSGIIRGTIKLPASKSESNRALLIQAISSAQITLKNLSGANDTVLLQRLLASPDTEINAEDAGTVMRFLTAYFSLTNQKKILTGTARMQERPIGILVEALREIGSEIKFLGQEGFPPLEITGFQSGQNSIAKITIRGDVSSQFISALLLCAPLLPFGLELTLTGKIASRPYIEMTLKLMQEFGITGNFSGNKITIPTQQYSGGTFAVEADWSAAGYWYSMVALAKEAEILLPGLKQNSLQGDSRVAALMEPFGVKTAFLPEGVLLTKTETSIKQVAIDFTGIPDLAQTFAVLAAAKNISLEMTGLESLRLKETDRISALQTELAAFGAALTETSPGTFLVRNSSVLYQKNAIQTYHDHRMAMAFTPLALIQQIEIENPEVVRKSYPNFWEELAKAGFEITEV